MVCIWGLRLGTFLVVRINWYGRDPRFDKVLTQPRKFFIYWMLQGVWVIVTSLPAHFVNLSDSQPDLGLLDYLGEFLSRRFFSLIIKIKLTKWFGLIWSGRIWAVDIWAALRSHRGLPQVLLPPCKPRQEGFSENGSLEVQQAPKLLWRNPALVGRPHCRRLGTRGPPVPDLSEPSLCQFPLDTS